MHVSCLPHTEFYPGRSGGTRVIHGDGPVDKVPREYEYPIGEGPCCWIGSFGLASFKGVTGLIPGAFRRAVRNLGPPTPQPVAPTDIANVPKFRRVRAGGLAVSVP
jgi:hypothetical protein